MNLINLYYCYEKASILMSIWIVGKDLMRHHYHVKKTFIQLKYREY